MSITVTIHPKNQKYQTTYGGAINSSDFCTDYEGTRNVARNILSDWSFDKECGRNIANINRRKGYKKNDDKE